MKTVTGAMWRVSVVAFATFLIGLVIGDRSVEQKTLRIESAHRPLTNQVLAVSEKQVISAPSDEELDICSAECKPRDFGSDSCHAVCEDVGFEVGTSACVDLIEWCWMSFEI